MLNMLKKKNGAEMSLNVIIIAVICLIVLVVLIVIFAMNSGKFSFGVQDCTSKGGECSTGSGNCPSSLPTGVYGYAKLTGTNCPKTEICCLPIKTS